MAGERLSDVLERYRMLYQSANRKEKSRLLSDFCEVGPYCRKYAIALLGNNVRPRPRKQHRKRYGAEVIVVLRDVWELAGYPWSTRLSAMIPLWLPSLRKRHPEMSDIHAQLLLSISPRQIDRLLKPFKNRLRKKLYGHTKPGTLLRSQIPIKTEHWDVSTPGYVEIDLVSHCGSSASGEFVHTLNVTDIFSGWSVGRAVLGRSEKVVLQALDEIIQTLPFPIKGIDSDNGSEFINHQLYKYCRKHTIDFVRSRPYKKDDNAHVEQKNWTHVRRIFGYVRFDTNACVAFMNGMYRKNLSHMMNLFQPSVKLLKKERRGSRTHRVYDRPRTPLDRLIEWNAQNRTTASRSFMTARLKELKQLRTTTDPGELSLAIDQQLVTLEKLRNQAQKRHSAAGAVDTLSKGQIAA